MCKRLSLKASDVLTRYLRLQVVLSAMILSECVYKLVDVGPADSAKAASTFVSQLPPGFVSLQHMQSVAASVPHRYRHCQKCSVHSFAYSVHVVFDVLQLPVNQGLHHVLAFTFGPASVCL